MGSGLPHGVGKAFPGQRANGLPQAPAGVAARITALNRERLADAIRPRGLARSLHFNQANKKQPIEETSPMYLFFAPSVLAFLTIFGISLRNHFAERTNI